MAGKGWPGRTKRTRVTRSTRTRSGGRAKRWANPNPNPNLNQVGEPMRTRSQGLLAAGDLVESPRAAGPNAPQLIPHNAKRRGSSRHILPEQLSDRPSACVADWSLEQSMAC